MLGSRTVWSIRSVRAVSVLVGAAVALTLSACGQPSAVESASQAAQRQPVLTSDFPDPDVLEHDGVTYAYATNANLKNVQVATVTAEGVWELQPVDALPTLPGWVIPGRTWAPEVSRIDDRFVLYFTATDFASSLQCIGVAVADDPLGPFEAMGDGMLICPEDEGGAIDASVAEVDGDLYLLWKNDGNCCGLHTWISASLLSDDGLSIVGEPIPLIRESLPWEGNLVEAPTLVQRPEGLALFYSANSYGGDLYATGFATAPSLAGPWEKSSEPLLTTALFDGEIRGPGGQDVIAHADDPNRSWLLIHGWNASYTARTPHVVELGWDGLRPIIEP